MRFPYGGISQVQEKRKRENGHSILTKQGRKRYTLSIGLALN